MNIALIIAGGSGKRMHNEIPTLLNVNDKPVITHWRHFRAILILMKLVLSVLMAGMIFYVLIPVSIRLIR